MTSSPRLLSKIQQKIWLGQVPLEIHLVKSDARNYDQTSPYIFYAPRLSYLPLFLPRLHAFFASSLIDPSVAPSEGWFSFEDVPLRWHHPLGLLFDLYSGCKEALVAGGSDNGNGNGKELTLLPWKLTLHFSNWPGDVLVRMDTEFLALKDTFMNSVKEAAFIRHSTAKIIMALGKEETTQLWEAVEKVDAAIFQKVHQKLMHPTDRGLLHVPIKIYLPAAATSDDTKGVQPGHVRVVQSLVAPMLSSRQPQTVGTALNTLIPALFPSRRSPLLAYPFLHGAVVPLGASVGELAEYCSYADGFLHVAIAMMG